MGAILGGTMRAPLTGIVFALELTHDFDAMVPLIVAVMIAHGFTVLVLRRSILTEKISRRGFHLSREYSIDPLEIIFTREVMRTAIGALPIEASLEHAAETLDRSVRADKPQRLFPVIGENRRLVGVVTRGDLREWIQQAAIGRAALESVIRRRPIIAYDDEPVKMIAFRMAESGLTRLPVVDRSGALLGMVSLTDLLAARAKLLDAEQRRERVLGGRLRFLLRSS
jgi:CBS domain-containing protein